MHECMDGWIDGWMHECMDGLDARGRMNGGMHGCMDGCMDFSSPVFVCLSVCMPN